MSVRLWLIEFVTSLRQRTDRAMLFPFWKGWAEEHGVEARWLCIGGRTEVVGKGWEQFATVLALEPEDEAALVAEVRNGRPTHLLLNEYPSASLGRSLSDAAPRASIASVTDLARTCSAFAEVLTECLGHAPDAWRRDRVYAAIDVMQREPWLAKWLGIPCHPITTTFRGHRVADRAAPRYDAEMLNEAAIRLQPMIRIVGGVFCNYRRPVRASAAYRDTDLSGCSREHGCAFCPVRSPAITRPEGDPLAQAMRQFDALLRAGERVPRDSGHYDIHDIRLFRRVDEFARRVCERKMPASNFYFSPRIDHILRVRKRLETALELFATGGHSLWIFRIGAESFSEAQQDRFNKGITRDQIEAVLVLIRDLERRWPNTFRCTQPLAFITFTPWTTLEEVRAILSEARRWGLPPRGRWLYSTLELDRDAPITALARGEGDILVREWEDAALRYATSVVATFREGQLAWRFRDSRVAVFHAILVRLCAATECGFPDRVFEGDTLYSYLRDRVRSDLAGSVEPLDFAEQLLDVMMDTPAPWDRQVLARETLARLLRRNRAGPSSRERLLWLFREVVSRWPDALPHTRVEDLVLEGQDHASIRLNIHGEICLVRIIPGGPVMDGGIASRRFSAVFEPSPRLDPSLARERISRVLKLLDVLVPRYAPGFLDRDDQGGGPGRPDRCPS